MSWSYSVADLATSSKDQVRRLIGDVLTTDQQLQDEEINWTLTQFANIYMAAAMCCRDIAAQFARKVDTVQGEMRTLYAQQTKNYEAKAAVLERLGLVRASLPYAGGISIMDKVNRQQDSDRVPPQFNLGMDDNLTVPPGSQGNQTPTPGSPDSESIP
jgi:hypothetical protein